MMKTQLPTGRRVRAPEGHWAFVPSPLPPRLAWNDRVLRVLSRADRSIGRLAGEGRKLPNPHLLIRPFIKFEAVYSSRIEGTQATLGELLAAEAGAAVDRSPDDLREVANYVAALEMGVKRLNKLPLSLRLVKELHKVLMTGVRGNKAQPGEFRQVQNWIGPPGSRPSTATFVPPPPKEMREALHVWEKFIHDDSLPPLVQIACIHYQFEAIHPFLDGNGRVGRLLITLFLLERGILPAPLLYLSAYFEQNRRDYYQGLRGVTEHGDWEGWLEYFLTGVAVQAEDAVGRIQRIDALFDSWRKITAGSASKLPTAILGMLVENPFVTIKGAATRLGVAYTSAQRAIERLQRDKIVRQVGAAQRDRIFCAAKIMDVLESPAQLGAQDLF